MTTRQSVLIKSVTRQILLCTLMLSPLHVQAGQAIRTELLTGAKFATEAEAVKSMKQRYLAESKRHDAEHMGAILQTDDGAFLATHGQAGPGMEAVTFTIQRTSNSKIVALWHTHGAPGRQTERFSIEDGQTVRDTGYPFYLITPKGEIKVLERTVKGKSRKTRSSERPDRTFVRNFRKLALYRLD